MNKYLNRYCHEGCPGTPEGQMDPMWTDAWSCQCNDDCPLCGAEIEPYESEEIDGE